MRLHRKKSDSIIFTFGRFNPPHSGHECLVNYMKNMATLNDADTLIVLSKSHNKKNPLTVEKKLKYFEEAFEDIMIASTTPQVATLFDVLEVIKEHHYNDVNLVLGSDRTDLATAAQKFSDDYEFNNFNITLYTRQNDISSTQMKQFVEADDLESFKKHSPSNLVKTGLYKKIFKDVKKGLK